MTTRILTGTYTAGYALSPKYSALVIAPSGVVNSADGAAGAPSTKGNGGAGGAGGLGVTIAFAATATNYGAVAGGQGGVGGYSFNRSGGAGGAGRAGLTMSDGGTAANRGGVIAGGAGGAGGYCTYFGVSGGTGGAGGAGIALAAGGVVAVTGGVVDGGAGGAGGYGGGILHTYAATGGGGVGGIGVDIKGAGSVVNSASIFGGHGGMGDNLRNGSGAGGAGIVITGLGSVANNGGVIGGGEGGAGLGAYGGGVGGAGGLGLFLVGGGGLVNSGQILGGAGGMGGRGSYDGAAGGHGGGGVRLGPDAMVSTINNAGVIAGGAGGYGASGRYYGGGGGAGGTGLAIVGPALVIDSGMIEGGAGGAGAYSGGLFNPFKHDGGSGGAGVDLAAKGTMTVTGQVVGGAGGAGGDGYYAGNGGVGGVGAVLSSGGEVINTGAIRGGAGGSAGSGYHAGQAGLAGDGVDLIAGGVVINGASSAASSLIAGRIGVYVGAGMAATVTNFGTVQGTDGVSVQFGAASDRLIAEAGSTFLGAALGGGGTLELAGGTGKITSLGAGGVSSGAVAMTFSGFGSYVVDAGGHWALTGASTLASGQSLTDNGALRVGGAFAEAAGATIASGAFLTFVGLGDTFGGAITGTGTVSFIGGSDTFDGARLGAARMIVNGATVTLEGSIVNSGTVAITTAALLIGAGGATLAGGTWAFSDSASNKLMGLAGGDTLDNASATISGAGMLGAGQMGLINRSAGVIDGNGHNALILDTGANRVANSGLIEAVGTGGVTIQSAVLNAGKLEANGGTLTANGAVSGPGTGLIVRGGLVFNSTFSEGVTFGGTSGSLTLAKSQGYTGSITGFSHTGGTSLDLKDIAFVSAAEATFSGTATSGVLTVTDGTHTAKITLIGNYLGSTFTASSDGHGGTTIVDPKPAVAPMVQAMASLGAKAAADLNVPPRLADHAAFALATPRPHPMV